MLNQIETKYSEEGKKVTMIVGDASIGISMRNYISTPNLQLKRRLKKRFTVYHIDEFRTSCIDHHTGKRVLGNLKYQDKQDKTRKLHSVLTYQMENKRLGCINRDINAVHNIKTLYNHYLR